MQIKRILALLLCGLFAVSMCSGCDGTSDEPDTSGDEESKFTADSLLKTDGIYIKDQKGNQVNLRGTNLGGWLHLEGWMDGGGTTSLYVTNEKRKAWTLRASNTDNMQAMTDADTTTLWTDNGAGGSYVIIDMKESVQFTSVHLECVDENPNEYLGMLKLSWSTGGVTWKEITSKRGNRRTTEFTGFDQMSARFLKIERVTDSDQKWNIGEVMVSNYTTVVDYDVRHALRDQFDEEKIDELLDVYQNAYITTADLDYIANLGMNVVRVPFYWMEMLDDKGDLKPGAFTQMDWIVKECGKRGIYVILDFHGSPGGHTSGWDTGGHRGSNALWKTSKYQNWVIDTWRQIAERYKGNPTIAGYDMLNEPVPDPFNDNNQVIRMYNRIYKAIRAVDPDHMIFVCAVYKLVESDAAVGGLRTQNFNDLDTIGSPATREWENVVYQTHHYLPEDMSAKGQDKFVEQQLALVKRYQQSFNVPILAGEFCFYAQDEAWEKWLTGLNEANINWTNWSYKNTYPDGENMRALFYGFSYSICFQKAPESSLRHAFERYNTKNYTENTKLAEILSKYAKA